MSRDNFVLCGGGVEDGVTIEPSQGPFSKPLAPCNPALVVRGKPMGRTNH